MNTILLSFRNCLCKFSKPAIMLFFALIIMAASIGAVAAQAIQPLSVQALQTGISGKITSQPVFTFMDNASDKESIILPTSSGLYILTDGNVKLYIPTAGSITAYTAIDDTDGDNIKDVVIASLDDVYPNVRSFSGATGKELWSFCPGMERYRDDRGWFQYQPPVVSLKTINNSGTGGKQGVILTAGYSVYMLEPSTGKKIWEYVDSDNVWDTTVIDDINANGSKDLIFGNQLGVVRAVEGNSGKMIWEKTLIEKYPVTGMNGKVIYRAYRSVWQINAIADSDGEKIILTAEDGAVYKLDPRDGSVVWKTPVLEYIDSLLLEYYGGERPKGATGLADDNFFNVRMLAAGDITGDKYNDLAVTTYFGVQNLGERQRDYKDKRQQVFLLDGKSGKKIWDLTNFKLPPYVQPVIKELNGKTVMLIPRGMGSSGETLMAIDLASGKVLDPVTIPISKIQIQGSNAADYQLLINIKSELLFASSAYDLLLLTKDLNSLVWSAPRMVTSKFVPAQTVDGSPENNKTLILFQPGREGQNGGEVVPARSFQMLDGKTGKVEWSYTVPDEIFKKTWGMKFVNFVPDINGDGIVDIIGTVTNSEGTPGDSRVVPQVTAISGADGKILFASPLAPTNGGSANMEDARVMSLDTYPDINGDKINEIFIGTQRDVFILNGKNGRTIHFWTTEPWRYSLQDNSEATIYPGKDQWEMVNLIPGDINGDGVKDIVCVGNNRISLGLSVLKGGALKFVSKNICNVSVGGINTRRARLIDDIDGDGLKELFFEKWVENAPAINTLISTRDGKILFEIAENNVEIDFPGVDFNGDKIKDAIIFRRWGEHGPELKILSGDNGRILWNYLELKDTGGIENLGIDTIIPAQPVDDMTGDGIPELAVIRNLVYEPGVEVVIYDIGRQPEKLVKVINIQEKGAYTTNDRWNPGIFVKQIKGRDNKSILAVSAVYGGEDKKIGLSFIDIKNGNIVSGFNIPAAGMLQLGDEKVLVKSARGEVLMLDMSHHIAFKGIKDGENLKSPAVIEWEGSTGHAVTLVRIDGAVVATTLENKAVIQLPKGNHEIRLEKADMWGKQEYASVNVAVDKTSKKQPLLIIFTATSLLLLLMLPLITSIKRKRNYNAYFH